MWQKTGELAHLVERQLMGTSKGNIGRQMYSELEYKIKMSKAVKLKRVVVEKICPKCNSSFKVERKISKSGE